MHIGKKILSHMLSERSVTFIHLYLCSVMQLGEWPRQLWDLCDVCSSTGICCYILLLKAISYKCERVLHKTGIFC